MNHHITNYIKIVLGLFLFSFFAISCDDNTATIGSSVMPNADNTNVSQSTFQVLTRSLKVDSLVANSSECYLGRVTDPETNATTTCNFLAQFYQLEDYQLPKKSAMHQEGGQVVADSVDLHLYIKSYFGDSLNSMKMGVYELDKSNILSESKTYYTNMDGEQYVSNASNAIKKTISFAVADLSVSDSLRYSSSYSKNIRVKLPKDYGTRILNLYYEHPEYFKNSYNFIRNVVPGFYFKVLSGNGTMVDIDVSTLNVYFRYTDGDSTYVGVQRVAATKEVLQNNTIQNSNIDKLLQEKDYTFIKTPAGIFTEVNLPIDSIYESHLNDSINSAKIVFKRHNNTLVNDYHLSIPSKLLLIRKSTINSFFANNETPDNKTSYVTSFSSTYNSYTFSNIANVISFLRKYRDNGAGITTTDTDIIKKQKIQTWESNNPDWNKVVLIPVTTTTNTLGSITSIHNDYSLSSTKLLGSDNNTISISIVYSHFNK